MNDQIKKHGIHLVKVVQYIDIYLSSEISYLISEFSIAIEWITFFYPIFNPEQIFELTSRVTDENITKSIFSANFNDKFDSKRNSRIFTLIQHGNKRINIFAHHDNSDHNFSDKIFANYDGLEDNLRFTTITRFNDFKGIFPKDISSEATTVCLYDQYQYMLKVVYHTR